MNLDMIQPGSAVFDASGQQIGSVADLSGDRFRVSGKRISVWIPYDWILLAHARTVVVNALRGELGRFERTRSSRWLRSA